MGFKDEIDKHQKEMSADGGFYKFTIGDHKLRVFSEPVRKDSRFGHGICYPGASYCDPVVLKKENDDKQRAYEEECKKEKEAGRDPKTVKKPSMSTIGTKWSVWAYIKESKQFAIVDMTGSVAQKVRDFMDSDEYGFQEFPMPYDITVKVTQKKVKNPTKKDIEYDVLAARTNTPIPDEIMEEYAKLTPISQIVERMQNKQRDMESNTSGNGYDQLDTVDYPDEEINPEDIPF